MDLLLYVVTAVLLLGFLGFAGYGLWKLWRQEQEEGFPASDLTIRSASEVVNETVPPANTRSQKKRKLLPPALKWAGAFALLFLFCFAWLSIRHLTGADEDKKFSFDASISTNVNRTNAPAGQQEQPNLYGETGWSLQVQNDQSFPVTVTNGQTGASLGPAIPAGEHAVIPFKNQGVNIVFLGPKGFKKTFSHTFWPSESRMYFNL